MPLSFQKLGLFAALVVAWGGVRTQPVVAIQPATAPADSPTSQPAATQPATQPSTERIAKLVHDLEKGELREVMAAQDELLEIGPPAVEPLVKMGRASRSRTTRVRVVMVLNEIIKRAKEEPAPAEVDGKRYPWTEPVAGIAMRLSVDREQAELGQLVRLRVDFRNMDDGPRPFAPLTLINLPRSGGGKVEGALKLGVPRVGKPGSRPAGKPHTPHPLEMTLTPGQTVTYTFRLNEKLNGQYKVMLMHDRLNHHRAGLALPAVNSLDMPLPAGQTKVSFVYYAASRGLLKGADADLAQAVTVTVAKPHRDDKPAE